MFGRPFLRETRNFVRPFDNDRVYNASDRAKEGQMSSCSYCNSIILWGGRQIGAFKFCNDKCAIKGTRALAAQQIPDDVVIPFVRRLHSGPCPKCGGPGPVDVFTAYSIWSAVVVTRWVSEPQVSCKPCGVKHQAVSLGKSLVLGWWGFPWGLIITPIQIVR